MEIMGTNFTLSLGGWRLRFVLAIEDADTPPPPKPRSPHKVRIVQEDQYVN
ncbi:MAG TPA: hypothetical protein VMF61_09545 [Candidatus Acidoferrales bacterium]|nr:hypothetical protein [Candidatus Acidoferrales bacterium]